MTTFLAFVFVLGVLIFVHELGHFIMARKIGVRVLKFSLGFGPRLIGFKRGDTEYLISAIPLGGYVKMAGENPDEPRTGRPDEFLSKSKWERFQVMIMGPAMNIILAVVLMAVVLAQGAEIPAYQDQPAIIGQVLPNSPAAKAGLLPGDHIIIIDGREIGSWEDFYLAVGTKANREVPIVVLRRGEQVESRVTPSPHTRFEVGDIGVLPDVHPHLAAVNPGEPAERAGLKKGDQVITVGGQTITFARQLTEVIRSRAEKPTTFTVLRGGQKLDLIVTPERRGDIGWIGVSIGDQTKTIQPGPFEAIGMSVRRNAEFSGLIFQTVWGLITRETSPRQLMGPVAIAQLSGESAQAGWIPLFTLMASISLNLGLLNLLPIPVLDGGHIFIMAIEGIARRDFSMRVKEKMFLAGFVLLMMLMVTVIYNDLTRIAWIENLMPWRR